MAFRRLKEDAFPGITTGEPQRVLARVGFIISFDGKSSEALTSSDAGAVANLDE